MESFSSDEVAAKLNGSIVKKQEVDAKTFLDKMRAPEGYFILIEVSEPRRIELHVYRLRDMVIYVSPKLYDMSMDDHHAFVREVEEATYLMPPAILWRLQW